MEKLKRKIETKNKIETSRKTKMRKKIVFFILRAQTTTP